MEQKKIPDFLQLPRKSGPPGHAPEKQDGLEDSKHPKIALLGFYPRSSPIPILIVIRIHGPYQTPGYR